MDLRVRMISIYARLQSLPMYKGVTAFRVSQVTPSLQSAHSWDGSLILGATKMRRIHVGANVSRVYQAPLRDAGSVVVANPDLLDSAGRRLAERNMTSKEP